MNPEDEAMKAIYGTDTIRFPDCEGCRKPLEPGSPCYAIQSGYIDEDGTFVREDSQSQLFHTDCV